MNSTEENEIIQTLIQYQHGFMTSQIMFTACELGVFDLLLESEESLSSATIAERLGTSRSGMEVLLGACVGLKLLRLETKNEQALYGNTELSSLCLAKLSPKSQYHYMMWFSKVLYQSFSFLTDSVREGIKQNGKISKESKNIDHFYEALYRSEEKQRIFLSAMNSPWSLYGTEMVTAFDLSPFPQICDLGGGGGALAKQYISAYPNSTVTILDLPEVVNTAKEQFVSAEGHRITFQEGDFFKDPVPEADLYILARIIHNWDDKKCVQLLTKVYKACKPGGGVLIIDMVVNDDRRGPVTSLMYSMVMLLHTEGKERTQSESRMLLKAAGFNKIQIKKTRGPYDAILAIK